MKKKYLFFYGFLFFWVSCQPDLQTTVENGKESSQTHSSEKTEHTSSEEITLVGVCPREVQYQGKFRAKEETWKFLQDIRSIFIKESCETIATQLGLFPKPQEHFVLQLKDWVPDQKMPQIEVRQEHNHLFIYLTFFPEYWLRQEKEVAPELAMGAIRGYFVARALQHQIPKFLQEALILYGAAQGESLTQQFFSQLLVSGKEIKDVLGTDPETFQPIQHYLIFECIKENYGGVATVKKFVELLEITKDWEKAFEEATKSTVPLFWEKFSQFQTRYLFSQAKDLKSFYEFRVALKHLLEQSYGEAAQQFQTLILKFPYPYIQGDASYRLGLAYYFQERFLEAEKKFADVVQKYSETTIHLDAAHFFYALCAFQLRQYETALQRFDAFLSYFPDSSRWNTAWYWKGLAYLEQNQEEKAEFCLKQVLQTTTHPKRRDALEQLAKLKKKQGKLQAAEEYYQQIAQENPDFSTPSLQTQQPLSTTEQNQVTNWLKQIEQEKNREHLIETGRRILPLLIEYLVVAPSAQKKYALQVLEKLHLEREDISSLWKLLPKLPPGEQNQLLTQFILVHRVPLNRLNEMFALLEESLRTRLKATSTSIFLDADPLLIEQLPDLLYLLNSTVSENRLKGIRQIVQLGAIEGIPVLLHFVDDPEEEVQIMTLNALAILGSPKTLESKLVPKLQDKNEKKVLAVLRVLHTFPIERESQSKIQPLLTHFNTEIQIQAIKTLANQNSIEALIRIHPHLTHPSGEIASLVEQIFFKLPHSLSIPTLIQGIRQTREDRLILKTSTLLRQITRDSPEIFEKDPVAEAQKIKTHWLQWWQKNQNRYQKN